MSAAAPTPVVAMPPVAQATNEAVSESHTAIALVKAAEENPVVKTDLQILFDSYSHNPIVMGLVPIAAGLLAQKQITVDNELLTVGVGVLVAVLGYGWQWLSMKINKPKPTAGTSQ